MATIKLTDRALSEPSSIVVETFRGNRGKYNHRVRPQTESPLDEIADLIIAQHERYLASSGTDYIKTQIRTK